MWNTLGHFLLKARKSIFNVLSFKQRDDHTCYIIKYSVILKCSMISKTKNWNRRMEQKAEELYEDDWCTSQTTVFSRWMGEMVLKYTENGIMFWKQSEGFNGSSEQERPLLRRSCSNLNHTGHAYCNCPLLFVCTVTSDSETAFESLLIVSRTLPVSVYFKTINTHSSTEKCGLGCAPTIFVQVFCFLLHSSVPVIGFTYRKPLEQLQNT